MTVDERDELPVGEARSRARAVLHEGAAACGSRGRHHATCAREPGHLGRWCEGPGFDDWGPRWVMWENPRTLVPEGRGRAPRAPR